MPDIMIIKLQCGKFSFTPYFCFGLSCGNDPCEGCFSFSSKCHDWKELNLPRGYIILLKEKT